VNQSDPKTRSGHILINLHGFILETKALILSPVFLLLTFVGNLVIGAFSLLFYLLEKNSNPKLYSALDAVWWGFATATTTGYGDITPVTQGGKVLGIILMLVGTALFAMFTALFADSILQGSKKNR